MVNEYKKKPTSNIEENSSERQISKLPPTRMQGGRKRAKLICEISWFHKNLLPGHILPVHGKSEIWAGKFLWDGVYWNLHQYGWIWTAEWMEGENKQSQEKIMIVTWNQGKRHLAQTYTSNAAHVSTKQSYTLWISNKNSSNYPVSILCTSLLLIYALHLKQHICTEAYILGGINWGSGRGCNSPKGIQLMRQNQVLNPGLLMAKLILPITD